MNVALSKLQKHDVNISQREIRRQVPSRISPRFSSDVNSFAKRKTFELSKLEAEVTHVESSQSNFERETSGTPALAVTLKGDDKRREGNEHSGAARRGK